MVMVMVMVMVVVVVVAFVATGATRALDPSGLPPSPATRADAPAR